MKPSRAAFDGETSANVSRYIPSIFAINLFMNYDLS